MLIRPGSEEATIVDFANELGVVVPAKHLGDVEVYAMKTDISVKS